MNELETIKKIVNAFTVVRWPWVSKLRVSLRPKFHILYLYILATITTIALRRIENNMPQNSCTKLNQRIQNMIS